MSFGRKGGPVSGTGLYKYDAVLFAVTARWVLWNY